jgi:hypothetical protein
MSKTRVKWAISFVFVLALCTSLHARRERWEYLGESHVDGTQDHDSIRVGRSAGTYRAIQLRISGGAINFERVIVRYGNGTQEEIGIRSRIPDGGQTRVIDLPGERRIIQSLDLWYGKDKWSKRPKVSLYGLRD